jgi:hypothetical protein
MSDSVAQIAESDGTVNPSSIAYNIYTNTVSYSTIQNPTNIYKFAPQHVWAKGKGSHMDLVIHVGVMTPYFNPNTTIFIPNDSDPSIVSNVSEKPDGYITVYPCNESVISLINRIGNSPMLETVQNDLDLIGHACVEIDQVSDNKDINKALTFYNSWMSEAKNVNGGIMNVPSGTAKFRDRFINEARQQYNVECVGIDDPSLIHVVTSIDGDKKAKIIISNTVESEPKTAETLCDLLSNENFSDPRHAYRCYDAKNGTIFRENTSTCANEFETINEKQKMVVGLGITVAFLALLLIGVLIYKR